MAKVFGVYLYDGFYNKKTALSVENFNIVAIFPPSDGYY